MPNNGILDLLDHKALEYLYGLDDDVVSCLGDHHDWEKLNPRKGIPAVANHDGSYQLISTCGDCGRIRFKTTLVGGAWDMTAKWEYRDGPRPPKGLGLTRTAYAAENGRRISEALRAQARAKKAARRRPPKGKALADSQS